MSDRKRMFVTGGASGLGKSLAERYARAGWRVALGDINEQRGAEALASLRASGATADFLKCDVRRDEDLEKAAAWLDREWGGVDLVFNNAGVAASGGIEHLPLTDWQWIVDINLLGVVRGCKTFTPLLQRQRHGHLVNIASVAGLVHPPFMAPYNATKAAVVALSETLHTELAPWGITVSVVCPSFFRTNLIETARCSAPELRARAERAVTKARYGADEIAEAVFQGVARRKARIVPDAYGRSILRLKQWLPYSTYLKLLAKEASKL